MVLAQDESARTAIKATATRVERIVILRSWKVEVSIRCALYGVIGCIGGILHILSDAAHGICAGGQQQHGTQRDQNLGRNSRHFALRSQWLNRGRPTPRTKSRRVADGCMRSLIACDLNAQVGNLFSPPAALRASAGFAGSRHESTAILSRAADLTSASDASSISIAST